MKQLTTSTENNTVSYPLQPIVSQNVTTKKNILFLVIDSWRFNSLSNEITPNIYNFSKKCQIFTNPISGSNMTTGGVFSLFYECRYGSKLLQTIIIISCLETFPERLFFFFEISHFFFCPFTTCAQEHPRMSKA